MSDEEPINSILPKTLWKGTTFCADVFSECRLAWPLVTPHVRQPSISRDRARLGIEAAPLEWLLVPRIVAGNDRARALTGGENVSRGYFSR